MTQQESRDEKLLAIDHLLREITWFAQKQAMHMLTHPDIELTLPQMITLFAIHERGTCRMSDLAESTQQSAGTLTGIVDRLIADELVTRVRNTADRRVVEVTLTPEGVQRLQQVMQARHEDAERMFGTFNDDELRASKRILQRILDGFQQEPVYETSGV
ncbi:MAG TPA: MarR family transcriptional regulator [Roseiflexaceae bacterium]|jgi:DNA-binding MarR family transcriptional regulator|nr:MarR family transcriptional regulator [Roseiflexaceae bacterium]